MKIYIETSVWNAAIATLDDYRQIPTGTFLNQAENEELYVSELVIGEIGLTRDSARRKRLQEMLSGFEPVRVVQHWRRSSGRWCASSGRRVLQEGY